MPLDLDVPYNDDFSIFHKADNPPHQQHYDDKTFSPLEKTTSTATTSNFNNNNYNKNYNNYNNNNRNINNKEEQLRKTQQQQQASVITWRNAGQQTTTAQPPAFMFPTNSASSSSSSSSSSFTKYNRNRNIIVSNYNPNNNNNNNNGDNNNNNNSYNNNIRKTYTKHKNIIVSTFNNNNNNNNNNQNINYNNRSSSSSYDRVDDFNDGNNFFNNNWTTIFMGNDRPIHKTHVEIITKNGATKKPNIIVNNYNPEIMMAPNPHNPNFNSMLMTNLLTNRGSGDFGQSDSSNSGKSLYDRKITCMLYLQADHTFFQKMGSDEASIEAITRHVQRANAIYKNTGE